MTDREKIILKANILGGMNEYVLNVIGDDIITEYWTTYGIPDECDEELLMELAEDDEIFKNITVAFGYCVKANNEEDLN